MFARRVKDSRPAEQRDPGWKLFGKIPPREGAAKDPKRIQKSDRHDDHTRDLTESTCEVGVFSGRSPAPPITDI
ncbi:TBC1 domain family member 12 [Liparis tanakae]|uniref:TBC1 domain family member 12 n=1 Tax=Liparis tanakae TaxID=230148 RepID=A0A4Z2EIJ8_9TELE|nr:TBC1 domain family member 12 [Liparis tanakae]